MKKQKSEAQLRWEEQYREQRADAKWEQARDFLARNPMCMSPRAMVPRPSSEGQESPTPPPAQSPSQRQL